MQFHNAHGCAIRGSAYHEWASVNSKWKVWIRWVSITSQADWNNQKFCVVNFSLNRLGLTNSAKSDTLKVFTESKSRFGLVWFDPPKKPPCGHSLQPSRLSPYPIWLKFSTLCASGLTCPCQKIFILEMSNSLIWPSSKWPNWTCTLMVKFDQTIKIGLISSDYHQTSLEGQQLRRHQGQRCNKYTRAAY